MDTTKRQRAGFDTAEMDRRIGERIRRRRALLGLTQDQLGEAICISYQQVQKYETGANRVSASRLLQIAQVLDAPVSSFYGDLGTETSEMADGPSSRHIIELVRAFSAIESEKVRMGVLALAKTLSSYQDNNNAEQSKPEPQGDEEHRSHLN